MKDGGPAFPVHGWEHHESGSVVPTAQFNGMSLRDAFALAALQGELSSQDERRDGKGTGVVTRDSMNEFARRIWDMADAMLATRGDR